MVAQETFAQMNLSRKAVFPGEPFRITVKTYTSTYYLSPIAFGDFQIGKAFTISFSRTLPGIQKINGKQYATLEFFFQVYPLESGLLEIPSIQLSFQSPPDGDYKGKLQQIDTRAAQIIVKPLPDNSAVSPWFVSNNLIVSDTWKGINRPLKIGDVIERNVTVKAYGTLPNFIPDLIYSGAPGIEVYPKAPELLDKRNDEQAIGWKTQKIIYLLTQEGDEIAIPELTIHWFNPLANAPRISSIKAKKLKVLPNPNLGILTTVRDSLTIDQPIAEIDNSEVNASNYKFFLLLLAVGLFTVYLLWKLLGLFRFLWMKYQKGRANYLSSEPYYYRQIFRNKKAPLVLINSIYAWWDVIRIDNRTISDQLKNEAHIQIWQKIQALNPVSLKELQDLTNQLTREGSNLNFSKGFQINP